MGPTRVAASLVFARCEITSHTPEKPRHRNARSTRPETNDLDGVRNEVRSLGPICSVMAAYRLGGILDSVAKEKGCVTKPATELGLHGKHNAEGNLVRGMALRMLLESVLRNSQALRGGAEPKSEGLLSCNIRAGLLVF